jgi:hypothetical protein
MVGGCEGLRKRDQLTYATITHAIVDVFAAPLALHKAAPAQALQVHRHTALRGSDNTDKVADIALTLQEGQEDVQAGRLTDARKDPRQERRLSNPTRMSWWRLYR